MTAAEPIEEARDILNDASTPYRWSDAQLLRWLSDGQREVYRRRPDLFMQLGAMVAPSDLSATTDDLDVGEAQRAALTDYVCARAFMVDADHDDNLARSTAHMNLFLAEIT